MHWFPMAAVANYHRVSVKTKEIYSITVLETGSLKSRHYGVMLPLRPVEGSCFVSS